jgi:hypothetical protein
MDSKKEWILMNEAVSWILKTLGSPLKRMDSKKRRGSGIQLRWILMKGAGIQLRWILKTLGSPLKRMDSTKRRGQGAGIQLRWILKT